MKNIGIYWSAKGSIGNTVQDVWEDVQVITSSETDSELKRVVGGHLDILVQVSDLHHNINRTLINKL